MLLNEETRNLHRTAELLLEVNSGATAIGTALNTLKAISRWQCKNWRKSAACRWCRRKT